MDGRRSRVRVDQVWTVNEQIGTQVWRSRVEPRCGGAEGVEPRCGGAEWNPGVEGRNVVCR